MDECNHIPFEKNKSVTYCKKCQAIVCVTIPNIGTSVNSGFNSSVKIYSYALRPKEIKMGLEISPFDTLTIILNQKNLVNINSDNFIDYLSKRSEVIKIIRSLTRKLGSGEEVFSMAVTLADLIFLKKGFDSKFKLESTSACCYFISCKYLNLRYEVPLINDIQLCLNDSSLKEIEVSEIYCLTLLDYKLNWFTPYQCLEFFLNSGIFFKEELSATLNTCPKTYKSVVQITVLDKVESAYQLSFNILNFVISDLRSLEFRPEHIACSIISIIRSQFNLNKWHNNFTKLYNIKLEDFEECYNITNKYIFKIDYSIKTLTHQ